jgi:broad specificity phosphatase PhoE
MARLIAALIRHGDYHQLPDTPSAHQPFPLTDTGRQQARSAVTKLQSQASHEHWQIAEVIHSSELLRAWETASIIAEHLDGRHQVSAFTDLAERGMGSAANLSISQIEEIVLNDPRFQPLPVDWKSNSRFRLPLQGAESLLEAGERVAGHLSRSMSALAEQATEDTLQVFVGHGAAIRHAAYVLGVLSFEEIAPLSMYHAQPVYFEYSEHSWKHVAGSWKVRDQKHELD